MVEFGNNPITVTPAPKRRKRRKKEPTSFGGEPAELSKTPIVDGEQAMAPVERPDLTSFDIDGEIQAIGTAIVDKPAETAPKVSVPDKVAEKPKPKKKKKSKHTKKKSRHGR